MSDGVNVDLLCSVSAPPCLMDFLNAGTLATVTEVKEISSSAVSGHLLCYVWDLRVSGKHNPTFQPMSLRE